jgi:hypothetical protein
MSTLPADAPSSAAGVGKEKVDDDLSDPAPEPDASDSDDSVGNWQQVRPRRAAAQRNNDARARLVANKMLVAKKTKLAFHITVRQGIKTRGKDAVRSMKQELESLLKKEAMHPVVLDTLSNTQRKKILRSSMFLKEKYNSMGQYEKLKSRLVANGKQQERSEREDTTSPTVKLASVMTMLAVAAHRELKGTTHDVGTAYLNANMTGEEVFVKLDKIMTELLIQIKPDYDQFKDEKGEIAMKLDKALYGCIQSARLWYERLMKSLNEWGYVTSEYDPCVFIKRTRTELVTLLVHVDDILCLAKNRCEHEKLANLLKREFKDTKSDMSDTQSYLGMTLDFSAPGRVKVSMEGYVETLLNDYGVTGIAESPATNKLFSVDDKSPKLADDQSEKFHTFACKLLYLSARIRSDISVATSFLCTRVTKSTAQDMTKLDRVLRYLNSTRDHCIVFENTGDLVIRAFIDASHATHEDGKGHMGVVVSVGLGPVLTKSVKAKLIAKSSTEDELIALSEFVDKVEWVSDFIASLGLKTGPVTLDMKQRPVIVYQDNKSTMAMVKQSAVGGKDRKQHLKVRCLLVKEMVDKGKIMIRYVPTTAMIADILTKPLQGKLFRRLRAAVNNSDCNLASVVESRGCVRE